MYQRDKEKLNADSECLHCFLKKIKVISNPKIHDWIQPIKHITRFDSWIITRMYILLPVLRTNFSVKDRDYWKYS